MNFICQLSTNGSRRAKGQRLSGASGCVLGSDVWMAAEGSVAWVWVHVKSPRLRSTANVLDCLWLFHDGRMLCEWPQPDRRGFRPNEKRAGCIGAFAVIPCCKFTMSFFPDILQLLSMFCIFIASEWNSDFRRWFLTVQWVNQLNYLGWLRDCPEQNSPCECLLFWVEWVC